jgi:hypothetical protein
LSIENKYDTNFAPNVVDSDGSSIYLQDKIEYLNANDKMKIDGIGIIGRLI